MYDFIGSVMLVFTSLTEILWVGLGGLESKFLLSTIYPQYISPPPTVKASTILALLIDTLREFAFTRVLVIYKMLSI